MNPSLRTLCLIAGCIVFGFAQAQAPNLDELEKRIEQGKKAKEQREAASRRADSEQKAQSSRMGALVVRSDAPCTLLIDSKRVADIPAGTARTISVQPGEQLVDCVSTEVPSVKYSGVQKARSGEKTVLEIGLAAQVQKMRGQNEKAARNAGFVESSAGILRETMTGLE